MFSRNYDHSIDNQLIAKSLEGNKAALTKLIKRHQDYIFNISLKLFLDTDDALDATQEVLIKVITNLKTYQGKSQFRTWLYRIAFNHFLNSPQRKMEKMLMNQQLQTVSKQMALSTQEPAEEFDETVIEEVRILCSTAMLMCLTREQRLLYVIGDVFGADHSLGAQLFNISKGNYRVKLHRAKADLLSYVSGRCGLVDAKNPCRCPKKTRQFVKHGIVDKNNLQFNKDFTHKTRQIVHYHIEEVCDEVQLNLKELFQENPFQVKTQIDDLLNQLIR